MRRPPYGTILTSLLAVTLSVVIIERLQHPMDLLRAAERCLFLWVGAAAGLVPLYLLVPKHRRRRRHSRGD